MNAASDPALALVSLDWAADAPCRGRTKLMHPVRESGWRKARAICDTCTLHEPCLQEALRQLDAGFLVFGMFAGLSPDEIEQRYLAEPRRLRKHRFGRGVMPHGTRPRYQAGCRCGQCRAAERDYRRSARARREAS